MACITAKAETEHYRVDEEVIDQMFACAPHTELKGLEEFTAFTNMNTNNAEKNAWVALALNTVAYFTGVCGIHRVYLGTSTTTFILYLCTGGGCGVVQAIDWIYLLVGVLNEDIKKFENKQQFIMF
jgi:TM2 domain-containing membrane protein YozV